MAEFNVEGLPWSSVYKLMIGAVVPRPIGWIATINEQGQPNLAPFSFFNVVCGNPPSLVFCPMVRGSDGGIKDTLRNVRATGQFVANVATEELAEAVNLTSTEFEAGVNEFEAAGVTAAPSRLVRPPRVLESPVNFECKVLQIVDIGNQPGSGSLVVGQVVYIHVDERVLTGQDHIDLFQLKPIARLAGAGYARVSDVFTLQRPPSQLTVKK